jgi:hypothetical protein
MELIYSKYNKILMIKYNIYTYEINFEYTILFITYIIFKNTYTLNLLKHISIFIYYNLYIYIYF